MKKTIALTLSLFISGASLFFALSLIDWNGFLVAMKEAHWWVLLPSTILLLLHFYLRAIRWRVLLPDEIKAVPNQVLFDGIMAGNLMTFLLPLRAGEFARPLLLSLKSPVPFPTAFASVVVERFFDLSMVLVSLAAVLPFVPQLPDWAAKGAFGFAVFGTTIFVGLVAGTIAPVWVEKMAKLCTSFLPQRLQEKLLALTTQVLEGLRPLTSWKKVLTIAMLTILIWVSNYWIYELGFILVGEHHSFLIATTVSVLLALAVAIPSAPGFIGVYQVACIAGFSLFGLSEEKGGAFAVLTHVHAYLLFVILGSLALARTGLSFKQLRQNRT